jgi:hypothetical protein
MSFGLRYRVDVVYLPDGAGAMEVPSSQVLTFFASSANPGGLTLGNGPLGPASPVPGGNGANQANFNTAVNNMLTDIEAQIAANLARIQAFATGGG